MTSINLLPWREELRQEQKKQFAMMAVMTALLAVAIWGLIHFQMQSKIDYQLSRNTYMTNEIKKLDEEIKEIRELQKVRRSLIERMEVIQDLQASRPSIVHLFTEIVSSVPNGVYLETLTQVGSNLTINGEAESNARVSTYMRNLSASEWLKDPNLTVIEIEDITVNRISTFTLTVKQTSPNATGEEEDDDGGLK
ncbi:MAG: PilN domain-containing protein [Gammaproteobacteria bacterium]|nr:PilN domain-containing protein [Gammaproteobacteria bacterium]MBT8436291.1 PilN domain-containing protein [Gammaproteobacteria bacterium]